MIINSTPNDVTWFSSSQIGSPQITSTDADGLIRVLDACLVTGWGQKNALSATIDADLITINYGSGHNYYLHQKIAISGADDSLLNGLHKIVSVTNNTVTIKVDGVISTGGSITSKVAPLGWESIFGKSDPLRRAYRSLASSSAKRVIYLDMGYPESAGYHATSPSRRAMVSVCSDMQVIGEQIGSYTDVINNKAANGNGSLFWYQSRGASKASSVSATPVEWKVIGNGDFFYITVSWSHDPSYIGRYIQDMFGFGEYAALEAVGQDSSFLMAIRNVNDSSTSLRAGSLGARMDGVAGSTYIFALNNTGFSENYLTVISGGVTVGVYSGLTGAPFPSSRGNFLFTHVPKISGNDKSIIGIMPSMLFIDHSTNGGYDNELIDGVLMVRVSRASDSTPTIGNIGFYVGD